MTAFTSTSVTQLLALPTLHTLTGRSAAEQIEHVLPEGFSELKYMALPDDGRLRLDCKLMENVYGGVKAVHVALFDGQVIGAQQSLEDNEYHTWFICDHGAYLAALAYLASQLPLRESYSCRVRHVQADEPLPLNF
ncbi:hypothetical protein [Deinococcus soli (ex Cha et al. 2016)]|uniref:Uncharacterized protein n=2 Tax=Deinococcus soli (ex Cha et al. 2016) TaxID=1309411 RepID=A0ACC6KHN4_9DEIO|nr:hypothetical protein [Deinococcus soli (ex Cha et al. 2016)]MDR6218779.1 hypothetical protein [Deinococcus soli (ex Cha et al. 2016)]MDR6328576.1 hypothetical protein [Deinococcus soli (ex Cha et al. 2016)]MDR6751937.1 hypothetical protein [Deinococcus soli (ex Cha et al. 2016)]